MKRWFPFLLTFTAALGVCSWLYFLNGSEIDRLSGESRVSADKKSADSRMHGKAKPSAKKNGPAQDRLSASIKPTRNGIRSLFERSTKIMEMDQAELEELLAELEAKGSIRSPISGISLIAAYSRLAEINPVLAMERAVKLTGELRGIAAFATMNQWLMRDRPAALAWFAKDGDAKAKQDYVTMMSFGFGGSDPELVEQLRDSLNDPEQKQKSIMDSISALAFSDPDAALKQLEKIEDPAQREEAEARVYQGFLYRYPDKALEYALAQAPGHKARDNVRMSVVQWGEQDAGAALKWVTSQNKDVRKELFDTESNGPGWGFGKATPEQIKDAAVKLDDQGQRDKLYAAYVNSRSQSEPTQALTELSNIRDKELQTYTAASVGTQLGRNGQTNQFNTWLETAPPNDMRDATVAGYIRAVAPNNPTAAVEMLPKITNTTMRTQVTSALKTAAVEQQK